MCNFQVLAQNADGYVVFCHDCKSVQLAFGTTLIKMRPEYFREISQAVRLEGLCKKTRAAANVKNIFIPLEEGITLCLTFQEQKKLEQLLSEATALFETYAILEQL
ncbi:DUF6686 family protein [Niabella ginsenosidivorans]|nr:DUF6686 family protein [Niabella ginsenosidivorans]